MTRYLQIVLRLYQDLHFSPQPRFHTELGLLKLVYAQRLESIEQVLGRIEGGSGSPTPPAPKGPSGPTPLERDHARRRAEAAPPSSAGPKTAAGDGFAAQLIARVEASNKAMLGISLERAVSWDVREDNVSANYPAGTMPVNMPDGNDQRLLANMASEILGRPVSFRASLLRPDAPIPAAASDTAVAAPPALTNIGPVSQHPELSDFLRHFPGAKVEEQKRRG